MQKNLVIVESPAKAKTIEKFLGKDYKVLSSFGHIRDLKKKEFSIDTDTFEPLYEIPADKKKLVSELKAEAKKAEMVWLASDEDREGEAISWHLFEVLGLKAENTRRIVFHEITKNAILRAIENPRDIDTNLVNAQQARRVLDRIVGFKLSPVLWRKVKPALSAGRVQSVAVRLIVEREREIQNFVSEASYRVTAIFHVTDNEGKSSELKAELDNRFKTREEAEAFLKQAQKATFAIDDIVTKPIKKSPAAPFTTSTLQQEAARKLGFTVSQTMMVAQRLYENGHITYMRTDSVNLSSLAINTSREAIQEQMGEEYVKTRQFSTKSKGAQEAHEAIRPTYMDKQSIEGTPQERRLYTLIWKRTIASQMADAELEKTTVSISMSGTPRQFIASGEVVKFDGFLRVYRESNDDEQEQESESLLPPLQKGQSIDMEEMTATERYTQYPLRYTEASLVRKLEELGIGRPSTYAPTISTIQQREYVEKGDKPGITRDINALILKDGQISEETRKETYGNEKSKLIPTDTGIVVNDFLLQYFPQVMDYNFTASAEKRFDEVAEGDQEWTGMIKEFYNDFIPMVEEALTAQREHKVGERILGNDPATGKPVSVKIGRFGPVVQIGTAEDEEKPRFAQMKKGQTMDNITLEEALELFRLPRTVGEYEGGSVTIGAGRFGPYVQHDGKYISIPKGTDPMLITLEEAIELIQEKRQAEASRHIKTLGEGEEMIQILNGRYGPYIAYKGKNYKIPKETEPTTLQAIHCLAIIEEQEKEGPKKPARKASTRKK
ncbi:MAG: type I DNA topoisomerase [Bacteroidaceae bacterium]|nr:type I DNA topoisomerase [Bacteroidaceae bacterium]MBR6590180.1 type I DNA topoisomerase [Bacteroidaceae bacterium]